MTSAATLVQLAAELTLFLVALAGAGLSLRHGLLGLDRTARALLVVGFTVLAGVAFLVGSLAVAPAEDPVAIAAVRVAGSCIVALGALRWAGSRSARPVLLVGLGLLVGASVAGGRSGEVGAGGSGPEVAVMGAALVMGVALVRAGRRTISGRIVTSTTAVLLMVILAVSVALSAVISATVEDEALRRAELQADGEARAVRDEAELALDEATLAAGVLATAHGPQLEALAAGDAAVDPRPALSAGLEAVVGPDGLGITGPVVLVTAEGVAEVSVPAGAGEATRLALVGDPVVGEARLLDAPRQGVAPVGTEAFAVGAAPVRVGDRRRPVGVVVVARPLDAPYLERRASEPDGGRSLVTREGVAASTGDPPSDAVLTDRAADALRADAPRASVVEGRVVAARPVVSEGLPPQTALVVSGPTDPVTRTREDLYRSLFLAALVAGLAGMVLATVVGERIGGGVRRLTGAAARIREGDLDARAAVDREDELGELSATFDAMAGSVRGLTGDLREAAEAEGRLRARLESVFAAVAEAVVAVDDDQRVTGLNPAAEELLGLAGEGAEGRRLDEVLTLVGSDGGVLPVDPSVHGTLPLDGAVRPAGPGEAVPVVGSVARLRSEADRPAGWVVVLRDVRRERALETAKRDFLAAIGHELRTPLTPIKGYAGVLRRQAPTATQARDWAEGISAGVTRLETLVDRLLAFSAVTATGPGSAGVGEPPVELGGVLADLVAEWRGRPDLDRTIDLVVAPDLPALVGDAGQLRLAVHELVDNAVRFAPGGTPVEVVAGTEVDDELGPSVVVTVRDAGHPSGLDLEAAVEAFRQGDGSPTRTRDGLGLGLALCARIAAAHGGRLRVQAPPDGGTRVSIVVPAVTPSSPSAPGGSGAPAEPVGP